MYISIVLRSTFLFTPQITIQSNSCQNNLESFLARYWHTPATFNIDADRWSVTPKQFISTLFLNHYFDHYTDIHIAYQMHQIDSIE